MLHSECSIALLHKTPHELFSKAAGPIADLSASHAQMIMMHGSDARHSGPHKTAVRHISVTADQVYHDAEGLVTEAARENLQPASVAPSILSH